MSPLFIFDIDGVITHPHLKKPNDFILSFIAGELNKKKPVALATGRAIAWIEKNILPYLRKKLIRRSDLDFLFICGEKGGVWMEFINDEQQSHVDETINFPKAVMEKVKDHVKKLNGVFYDPDKFTMVSVEINGGENAREIKLQKETLRDLEIWLKKEIIPQFPDIYSDLSEISVDILKKGINKSIAGKKFLEFLKRKNIEADNFVMFGDSPSDVLVAKEIFDHGKKIEFIYVGKDSLKGEFLFPITLSPKGKVYDAGVEELLKKMQKLP